MRFILLFLFMSQDSSLNNDRQAADNYRNFYDRGVLGSHQRFSQNSSSSLVLKVLTGISLLSTIIVLMILSRQSGYIESLQRETTTLSMQVYSLNSQLKQSLKLIESTFKNHSSSFEDLQHQVLIIQLQLVKSENHNLKNKRFAELQKERVSQILEKHQYESYFRQKRVYSELQPLIIQSKAQHFPKIIWIYTQHSFQNAKMIQVLLGNYIAFMAKQSGFQVRKVNSYSAYEWLSPETISKITFTMQNMKIEESVSQVLKLALLKQHGGVIMKPSECFLINNLHWIQSHFKSSPSREQQTKVKTVSQSEVLLFLEDDNISQKPEYQDHFIAAIKNSSLISDAFNILCTGISTGILELPQLKTYQFINREMNSTKVKHFTKNILNSLIDIMAPTFYSVSSIDINTSLFVQPQCRDHLPYLLKRPDYEYHFHCGLPQHIIHISDEFDRRRMEEEMEQELLNENLGADQFGYWHDLMVIQQNRQLFDPLPKRDVRYCLIDAHPQSNHQFIINSFEKLKQQTYHSWAAIYFIDHHVKQNVQYAQNQTKLGYRISVLNHSGSIGRNYEVAITKHCPDKSFAFVLRRREVFSDPEDLQILSYSLSQWRVLGAFVGLNISGKVHHSSTYYEYYNKVEFNGNQPQYNALDGVLNYLRVFHTDCYKILPQFALRTPEGVYFNDRFVFLEQFLFMVRNLTDKHDDTQIPHEQKVSWFIKTNAHIFDVPNRILLHQNLIIHSEAWEHVDKIELKHHFYKADSYAMTFNMDHLVQNGIPMKQFAVYNPGNEFEPYTVRDKPQLIPKIIHIIWIQGQMPDTKKKILEMNKKLYPDFQFKIWGKANITKEKFPLSYNLLQNIFIADKTTRYSKLATMADVLRHEALYYEGGFYMDTSMILFTKVLQQWLSYKFVVSTERIFRHRWAQSMCIFGVMPKFPGLLREISPNNTNRYNIYLRDALEIAGPHDFRWLVRGDQEYDPDYLIMDYDVFYPMTYSLPNFYQTYCLIQRNFLEETDQVILEYKNRAMIKNCGKYYPLSHGKEINAIGSSWQGARW